MDPNSISPVARRKSAIQRLLDTVEFLGNLLPHPVSLFALLAVGVLLMSATGSALDWQALDPRPLGTPGRSADGIVRITNLLNDEGLRLMVSKLVTNYTSFVPLGTVLVALLGVGVAEHSGLLSAALRGVVLAAGRRMVTVIVVFAGIMSNTASELGYVVLIPLAAALFHSLGRNPLAGLAAAFAGVSGGYSANLLLGTVDPLLAGITERAAQLIDPSYAVSAAANWYFMIASTFLITLIGTLVSEYIVEPKLGPHRPQPNAQVPEAKTEPLSRQERRALMAAGLTLLALAALISLAVIPEGAPLRNPNTGELAGSAFLSGIVALIFVCFLLPGIVYGWVTGRYRSDRDVIAAMGASMSAMGIYLVLVFFAAQFVTFFSWSNMGTVLAIVAANSLKSAGLTGAGIFIVFILICAGVNLMLGSASAQWAATAPIFVPMLMLLGYSPEIIQAAYRIGDSVSNLITPMMSYFGLVLALACRYRPDMRIGTMIAMMLPYSVAFTIGWSALFYIWVFMLGLPVGPASPVYYP